MEYIRLCAHRCECTFWCKQSTLEYKNQFFGGYTRDLHEVLACESSEETGKVMQNNASRQKKNTKCIPAPPKQRKKNTHTYT